MPVDYKALGSRIAHYRGKLNLSQEDLAEQVSLSREYINKIETAARVCFQKHKSERKAKEYANLEKNQKGNR